MYSKQGFQIEKEMEQEEVVKKLEHYPIAIVGALWGRVLERSFLFCTGNVVGSCGKFWKSGFLEVYSSAFLEPITEFVEYHCTLINKG